MSMTNCSECGNAISDQALTCPACGAPTGLQRIASSGTPGWKTWMWVGISLFVIATFAVLLADLSSLLA